MYFLISPLNNNFPCPTWLKPPQFDKDNCTFESIVTKASDN